jgi:hypothetical protein
MVALYQYFGFQLPLKERFAMIKAAGFDTVGLWRDGRMSIYSRSLGISSSPCTCTTTTAQETSTAFPLRAELTGRSRC